MTEPTEKDVYYFLGIGGIGMSALARYFHRAGKIVMGYDRTPSALTTELEMEGISITFNDRAAEIPTLVHTLGKDRVEVVYTPAIPLSSALRGWFEENGFELKKRSVVLGELTANKPTIAIAGTHGKTTTSSIVAHLLYASGHGCNAFLGGITANYGSNFLYTGTSAWNVVEADEYDRSFLTLSPDFAVITSVDADHLDIYGDVATIEAGYRAFADRVKPGGILLVCDRAARRLDKACRTYGVGENADYRGTLHPAAGRNAFTLTFADGRCFEDIPLPMPGQHNLENTLAAVAIALEIGVSIDAIRGALHTFKGIKRRFEYQARTGDTVFIDDYAHHPEELRATIEAVRSKHPGKRIMGVFQPHLFSRTRDLAEGFATSLALLDEILLLEIYPAREEPIDGIDSQWLLDKISHTHKKRVDKSQLLPTIREAKPEVLLTLGAGDIDREVEPIRRMLEEMQND